MTVLVVGMSHNTAPTEVLERSALGAEETRKAMRELAGAEGVTGAVVLATCTRIEIYVDTATFHGGVDTVSDLLSRVSGMTLAQLQEHLYLHHDARAVQHLLEVTCGLDSVLVGEAQIQGQVREAIRIAGDEGTLGQVLGELFRHAVRTGRRARSETGIDAAARSLVGEGIRVASQRLDGLTGRTALVVGAGATGVLAVAALQREGIGRVLVSNRTAERAHSLVAAHGEGYEAVDYTALGPSIDRADVVVCSTSGIGHSIVVDDVSGRSGTRPLVFVDLAMPRDVDPRVCDLPGVTIIDIDTLRRHLAEQPVGLDIAAVAQIIDEEVLGFASWQHARAVAPTVTALREQAARVVEDELQRLSGRLGDIDPAARAEIAITVGRVVDKLLHAPTVRVKELAAGPRGGVYAEALRELFGLDRETVTSLSAPAPRAVDP